MEGTFKGDAIEEKSLCEIGIFSKNAVDKVSTCRPWTAKHNAIFHMAGPQTLPPSLPGRGKRRPICC